MATGRFDVRQLSDEMLAAIELTYKIACDITKFQGSSVYNASDIAAAWDIRQGIEYLRTPVEWVTYSHQKEPYKRHE